MAAMRPQIAIPSAVAIAGSVFLALNSVWHAHAYVATHAFPSAPPSSGVRAMWHPPYPESVGCDATSPGGGGRAPPSLVVAVPSRLSDGPLREEIRARARAPGGVLARGHALVFIMSDVAHAPSAVREESEVTGDMYFVPGAREDYADLTSKTRGMAIFFSLYALHNSSLVLVKCDDDVVFDAAALEAEIGDPTGLTATVWGDFMEGARADRRGATKWKTDTSAWPFAHYPRYPQGYLYAMTRDVANMVAASPVADPSATGIFGWEDVAMGAWIDIIGGSAMSLVGFGEAFLRDTSESSPHFQ